MNRINAMPAALGAPYTGNTLQPADPYAEFSKYVYSDQYEPKAVEEALVQTALTYIEDARIHFTAHDRDRRLVMHAEGLPRVEYFPLKNRWREAGSNKRHHGTVVQFVEWYRERAGVRK